ncbi:MAG: helix-turn-helix transcriptional regulator [Phycisphaeraceae bacterium]|nr:helix-turn-helix transcriptional regulator [Phycisphaeraceae bacterium]
MAIRPRFSKGLPAGVLQHWSAVFADLAHPKRLKILELLDGQRLSVAELAALLQLPLAVTSGHLGVLRRQGILAPHRQGRQVYYRVADRKALRLLQAIRNEQTAVEGYQDGEAI